MDAALTDRFSGHASVAVDVVVAKRFVILVRHPRHFSFAGRHVGRWYVDSWSEEAFFGELGRELSGDFFELVLREFFWVDADSGFATAERYRKIWKMVEIFNLKFSKKKIARKGLF